MEKMTLMVVHSSGRSDADDTMALMGLGGLEYTSVADVHCMIWRTSFFPTVIAALPSDVPIRRMNYIHGI